VRVSLLAIGACLLAALPAPDDARATGVEFPGETLALSQLEPAVAGRPLSLTASGTQTDIQSHFGGFTMNMVEKPAGATCAPSWWQERVNLTAHRLTETDPVIGLFEGEDASFSLPLQIYVQRPGAILLCAYSTFAADTAAAAPPLTVSVATSTADQLVNVERPRIERAGNALLCSPGSWRGHPTRYAYRWRARGLARTAGGTRRLALAPALARRTLRCAVTATNATGSALAISAPFPPRRATARRAPG
jgi:hypothetical protein